MTAPFYEANGTTVHLGDNQDVLPTLAAALAEEGDPDGRSPWACRSGQPVEDTAA